MQREKIKSVDAGREEARQYQYLRLLKTHQRIHLAFELHDMAHSRVAGEVKRLHPDWSAEQLRDEVNRRFIG